MIVFTFTYLLVGAAIFDVLESETEKRRKEALDGTFLVDRYRLKKTTIEPFYKKRFLFGIFFY